MRPFLKYPGNKYDLLPQILPYFNKSWSRLIEPFVGSGAVFLNTDYKEYILGDINKDLINLYKTLQTYGYKFIKDTSSFFTQENNQKDKFLELRFRFNSSKDVYEKSILFVYLNRHCFNGLLRFNKQGHFNSPFGRYKKPYFPGKEMTYFYGRSLKGVQFYCQDFETTMDMHNEVDTLIYCDPPYFPISTTSSFTSFSPDGFGLQEQERLRDKAIDLTNQYDISILISNSKTPETVKFYSENGLKIAEIYNNIFTKRRIAANKDARKQVGEILVSYRK